MARNVIDTASKEQEMCIFNFMSKFIMRGDKVTHMYRMLKELGMTKRANGKGDYSISYFYRLIDDMKYRLDSRKTSRQLQSLFNDMWNIYRSDYIRDKLDLSESQFQRMLTRNRNQKYRYPSAFHYNTNGNTSVEISLPDVVFKRLLIENGTANEIIESALRDYFRMPGGQNEQ